MCCQNRTTQFAIDRLSVEIETAGSASGRQLFAGRSSRDVPKLFSLALAIAHKLRSGSAEARGMKPNIVAFLARCEDSLREC